jgi:periplasmic protein TonB
MTEHVMGRPPLDDPWQRLVWILPAALAIWLGLIAAFSVVLGEREAPEQPALDARIIELPPPVPVGLQGGGPKAAPAVPKPIVKPAPVHHAAVHKAPAHVTIASPKVSLPLETRPAAPSAGGEAYPGAASEATEGSEAGGSEGGEGTGGGVGPGSDSGGARAIVAPKPVIPDDLREEAMSVVAVARFTVSSDGTAHVALIQATRNPRLNQILLDTLAKWQFFPAVRNGEPIDSTIDIRIPITVQ